MTRDTDKTALRLCHLLESCQIDIARTAVSLYIALLVCLLNLVPAAQL